MIYALQNRTPRLPVEGFVADSATVIGSVVLHEQTSIWFGVVLRGDIEPITIGERSNIQDNSVAHTSRGCPVVVGRGTTVGHSATIHGCTVGDNCLVGMRAVVMDGAVVGDNCIVGAGALVKPGQQIPAGSLVVGSPGRILRQLSEEDIADIGRYAERYLGYYRMYLDGGLRPL